jgi:glycosyltransferase involved in cell wall biosynthesis
MKLTLVDMGCPAGKVTVYHLGVDVDAAPFSKREYLNRKPVRLLFAATFTEKNGLDYALRSFAKVLG